MQYKHLSPHLKKAFQEFISTGYYKVEQDCMQYEISTAKSIEHGNIATIYYGKIDSKFRSLCVFDYDNDVIKQIKESNAI